VKRARTIVAIGGGQIRTRSTLTIDREIIRLTGKKRPSLLFVPTASSDSEICCRRAQEYFGGVLKCRTDVLLLLNDRPSHATIRDRIFAADIIYVGGGNTLMMMRVWRRLGVDKLLRSAYENGCVLCGISAGAICWFDSGHSDSMSFTSPKKWKYIKVRGLGLLPGTFCPHYNGMTSGQPRRSDFREMIRKTPGAGLGVENNCAIEFLDGRAFKVIRSKPHAGAYRLCKSNGRVLTRRIPANELLLVEDNLCC
jgi:dipeptidase E